MTSRFSEFQDFKDIAVVVLRSSFSVTIVVCFVLQHCSAGWVDQPLQRGFVSSGWVTARQLSTYIELDFDSSVIYSFIKKL